jgi:hypothetical protein
VHFFQHVEGRSPHHVHRAVGRQNFQVESIAVEGDDASKVGEFGEQRLGVRLKPAPEAAVFVPGDRDGDAEIADVRPSAGNFVRQSKRFNIQKNFAIEQSGRKRPPEMSELVALNSSAPTK